MKNINRISTYLILLSFSAILFANCDLTVPIASEGSSSTYNSPTSTSNSSTSSSSNTRPIEVSKPNRTVSGRADTILINVKTPSGWIIETESDWCKPEKGYTSSNGKGVYSSKIFIKPNLTKSKRTAILLLSTSSDSQTIALTQEVIEKVECYITKKTFEWTETLYTYNDKHQLISEKNISPRSGKNNFEFLYKYNSNGKLERIDKKLKGENSNYFIHSYNSDGLLKSIDRFSKDESSSSFSKDKNTELVYNDKNQVVRISNYRIKGGKRVSSSKKRKYGDTYAKYFYDEKGNVIKKDYYSDVDSKNKIYKMYTKSYKYDNKNNPFYAQPLSFGEVKNKHNITETQTTWGYPNGSTNVAKPRITNYTYNVDDYPMTIDKKVFVNKLEYNCPVK